MHRQLLDLTPSQKRALSLSLFCAGLIYLGLALAAGKQALTDAARALGVGGWFLILACSFGNYVLRFLRWQYFLRCLGQRLPWLRHFTYYLAGFALTTTPAKAGETIRSLYLKSHGVRIRHSLASFFCERFLDLLVVTLLASLVLLQFADHRYFIAATAAVLLGMLAVLRSRGLLRLLSRLAGGRRGKLARLAEHLACLLEAAQALLRPRPLSAGLLLGLLAWAVQGLAFAFILTQLGQPLPLPQAFSIYAISLLAGALSFIPGGIGATEAVMYLLLFRSGVAQEAALVIPIISRVSTLWFAVALGLLASMYLGLRGSNEAEPERQA